MNCPTCQTSNSPESRFCFRCGRQLAGTCPQCGSARPGDAHFCASCGHRFDEGASQSAAERRQLTVVFFDIVGSTALSSQLDPEDLRQVIRGYQQASADIVRRHEGHIAQYLGDGILVYFGYPHAHEDDARRAV
jgi:hypothetical protein